MCAFRLTDKDTNPKDRTMKREKQFQHTLLHVHDLETIITKDGSKTIARKESGLLYRSEQGAQQESINVFVEGSGILCTPKQWNVFELGFGTGMNFTTTLQHAQEAGVQLYYETVDHMPVPAIFGTCSWAKKILELVRKTMRTAQIEFPNGTILFHPYPFEKAAIRQVADAIYHDPFGPSDNPEGWSLSCFQKEASILSETGIWTSYGASGAMRRALARSGMYVAIGPSIGKKRETTRASKSPESLHNLKIKYKPSHS